MKEEEGTKYNANVGYLKKTVKQGDIPSNQKIRIVPKKCDCFVHRPDDMATSSQSPAKRLKVDNNIATVSTIFFSSSKNRKVAEETNGNVANVESDDLERDPSSSE